MNLTDKKDLKNFDLKNFFLCVTHLNERKNILNLLKAQKLIYNKYNIKLVLVGKNRFDKTSSYNNFLKIISDNPSVEYISGLNKKVDKDLKKLNYRILCSLHVYVLYGYNHKL